MSAEFFLMLAALLLLVAGWLFLLWRIVPVEREAVSPTFWAPLEKSFDYRPEVLASMKRGRV